MASPRSQSDVRVARNGNAERLSQNAAAGAPPLRRSQPPEWGGEWGEGGSPHSPGNPLPPPGREGVPLPSPSNCGNGRGHWAAERSSPQKCTGIFQLKTHTRIVPEKNGCNYKTAGQKQHYIRKNTCHLWASVNPPENIENYFLMTFHFNSTSFEPGPSLDSPFVKGKFLVTKKNQKKYYLQWTTLLDDVDCAKAAGHGTFGPCHTADQPLMSTHKGILPCVAHLLFVGLNKRKAWGGT